MAAATDKVFAGSIPALYDEYLVPLIFAQYAQDMARRVRHRAPARVLEIAAGTGAATRALSAALGGDARLVATDLNAGMIERARRIGTAHAVEWREADAMQLPFDDAQFDCVVCQFGAMFFPDRRRAYAEARRVLSRRGTFAFSVWDRIEANDVPKVVTDTVASMFPRDPPRFLARTPHGYHDLAVIEDDLRAAGFDGIEIETVAMDSVAPSARHAAVAFCQGTPLRNEIEARGGIPLDAVTERVEAVLVQRFGPGPVVGRIQAHVAIARR